MVRLAVELDQLQALAVAGNEHVRARIHSRIRPPIIQQVLCALTFGPVEIEKQIPTDGQIELIRGVDVLPAEIVEDHPVDRLEGPA